VTRVRLLHTQCPHLRWQADRTHWFSGRVRHSSHWAVMLRCENSQDRSPGPRQCRRGPNEGLTARPTALRPPPLTGLSVPTGQDQATRTPGSHSGSAQKAKKPGLGAGPGHPEPRRKGEMTLGPSKKIMPLDPYSTLGRSCEPAYQVDSPTRGLGDDVKLWPATGVRAGGWSAAPTGTRRRQVAARRARAALDHASCDQALKTDRPRQRAFRDVPGG
jgi:hypothetical protein